MRKPCDLKLNSVVSVPGCRWKFRDKTIIGVDTATTKLMNRSIFMPGKVIFIYEFVNTMLSNK